MKKFILGLLTATALFSTISIFATTPKRELRLVMVVTECPQCSKFTLEVEEAYVEKEITEQCHECGYFRWREMEPGYVYIYGDVVQEYNPKALKLTPSSPIEN